MSQYCQCIFDSIGEASAILAKALARSEALTLLGQALRTQVPCREAEFMFIIIIVSFCIYKSRSIGG